MGIQFVDPNAPKPSPKPGSDAASHPGTDADNAQAPKAPVPEKPKHVPQPQHKR